MNNCRRAYWNFKQFPNEKFINGIVLSVNKGVTFLKKLLSFIHKTEIRQGKSYLSAIRNGKAFFNEKS